MPVNVYGNGFGYDDPFSIIPKKSLIKFKVYAISEDNETSKPKIYEFKSVKSLS
jgi:hypothetical protein